MQRSFDVRLGKHSGNVACGKPVDKVPLIIFQIQLDPSDLPETTEKCKCLVMLKQTKQYKIEQQELVVPLQIDL